MTEAEWFACNEPGSLIPLSWEKTQGRKILLFGSACCRRIWGLLIHPATRTAVEVVERYADVGVERFELVEAAKGARLASGLAHEDAEPFASAADPGPASYEMAAHAAYKVAYPARPVGWQLMREAAEAARDASGRLSEAAEQVALIRDIFGNPFRPVTFSPSWRTDTVVTLARQMYDARDFSAMPILADALQDAGCENEDVLEPLPGAGTAYAGAGWWTWCWARSNSVQAETDPKAVVAITGARAGADADGRDARGKLVLKGLGKRCGLGGSRRGWKVGSGTVHRSRFRAGWCHLRVYLGFYNTERLHQPLDYRSTAEVYGVGTRKT